MTRPRPRYGRTWGINQAWSRAKASLHPKFSHGLIEWLMVIGDHPSRTSDGLIFPVQLLAPSVQVRADEPCRSPPPAVPTVKLSNALTAKPARFLSCAPMMGTNGSSEQVLILPDNGITSFMQLSSVLPPEVPVFSRNLCIERAVIAYAIFCRKIFILLL